MKKLIFILLLSFAYSGISAQVWPMSSNPVYSNGDTYGYYVDEVPDAVSYVWSVQGTTGATIWSSDWETAVDLTHSNAGICDITCTITLDNGSVLVYTLTFDVFEQDDLSGRWRW